MNTAQLIQMLTPVLVPVLIALEAKFTAKIPSWLKPILATVLGSLIDLANHYITGATFSPATGAALGAAGVGLREVVDQLKQMLSPSPTAVHVTSVPPKA
jgi:hypothetical protein